VLAEIDALDVPEIVVVNKSDLMDPGLLQRLAKAEPEAIAVSARTGDGLDELRRRIAAALPRPDVAVSLLVPYDRGDLVARVHSHGDVQSIEHTADGTRIEARVPAWLAGEVVQFDEAASPA
jgi:GTP-binding protein HflX